VKLVLSLCMDVSKVGLKRVSIIQWDWIFFQSTETHHCYVLNMQ